MNVYPRIGAITVTLLLTVGLFSGVTAVSAEEGIDLDAVVDEYNQNIDQAPGFIQSVAGGERVELRVGESDTVPSSESGEVYWMDIDDDGLVVDSGDGAHDDPTIRVRTTETAVNSVLGTGEPADAFGEAYADGDIVIEGVGLSKTVQVELAKLGAWIGQTLGLF